MQVAESEITRKIDENRQAINDLEPATPQREIKFDWLKPDGQPIAKSYIQAELGMFPSQEFGTLVTSILDSFIKGEMGMSIGELFRGEIDAPVTLDAEAVTDFVSENVQIIQAFVKVVQIAPDFQKDVICLSLGIPRMERAWAKEQMSEPPHRGGLTVNDGFDILKVFIQQNATLLRETFLGKARELVEVFRLEVLGQQTETEPTEEEMPEESEASLGGTPSSTFSLPTPVND